MRLHHCFILDWRINKGIAAINVEGKLVVFNHFVNLYHSASTTPPLLHLYHSTSTTPPLLHLYHSTSTPPTKYQNTKEISAKRKIA